MPRILIYLFIIGLSWTELSAESAQEFYKHAQVSLGAKEYEKALKLVNKAILADSGFVNGILLRAEINFMLSEYENVISDVSSVFSLNGQIGNNMPDFYLLRANAYLKVNRLSEAMKDVDYCIKINPMNAQAYFLKGMINIQETSFLEALTNYDEAIKFDSDVSEYYYQRAELKKMYFKPIFGSKEYNSIMSDIQRAMQLNPDDYRPSELQCDMLKLDTSLSKADLIKELDVQIEHFPKQSKFYSERGIAKVLINQYGAALSDFTKAIQLDENNEANYRNRALCFHNMRKYQLALNDYSKSIDVLIKKYNASHEDASVKRLLAQTFNMRGMTNKLNGYSDLACDDFYNAAKLGSKTGLNNYRKGCNVFN